jgi:uncharacterized protein
MNNPVGWFEIYVDDMARAKSFFENVLERKLERLNSPVLELWAFPMGRDEPGAAGALAKMPNFPAGRKSVLVYFSCDDCAVQEARVKKFGGASRSPSARSASTDSYHWSTTPKAICSGCIR